MQERKKQFDESAKTEFKWYGAMKTQNPASVGTYGVTPTYPTRAVSNQKPIDPYQNSNGQEIFSLHQFCEANKNLDYWDIVNQLPKTNGLYGGPKMRYVRNPTDGRVMDMRHVMVVGFLGGNVGGLGVEIIQKIGGLFGSTSGLSAFDKQDFYSNSIGASFNFHMSRKITFPNSLKKYDWSRLWVKEFYLLIAHKGI